MLLKEVATGKKLEAIIEPLTVKDFKIINRNKLRFNKFDWRLYRGKEVYKIRLKSDEIILGLICLIEHTGEATNAIEVELLEISAENIGNNKKIDNITGCLIAFACRESFKREHDGFVFLTPKTYLLEHYRVKYGFEHFAMTTTKRPNGFMFLYGDGARKIIKEYLE